MSGERDRQVDDAWWECRDCRAGGETSRREVSSSAKRHHNATGHEVQYGWRVTIAIDRREPA